jgi:hypothetical protein
MVLTSLALTDLITTCGLPAPVAPRIDGTVVVLAAALRDRTLSTPGPALDHAEHPFSLTMTRLRDRPLDQAWNAAQLALTPTPGDWAAVPLPRGLRALYFAIRPFRLAARYGRRLRPRMRSG